MDYRIEQLRFHLREDPNSRRFYQLGELLRKEGELEEAAQILRDGLKQHSRYVAAWVSLGRTLCAQGALAEGEEAFAKALELDPENAVAARMIGRAAKERGEWLRAVKALKLARALSPRDEELEEEIAVVEQKLAGIGQLEGGPPPLPGEGPDRIEASAPAAEIKQAAAAPVEQQIPSAVEEAPFAPEADIAPVLTSFEEVEPAAAPLGEDSPFHAPPGDLEPPEAAPVAVAEPLPPPAEAGPAGMQADDPFAQAPPGIGEVDGASRTPAEDDVFAGEPGPAVGAGAPSAVEAGPFESEAPAASAETDDVFAMTSDDPLSVQGPSDEPGTGDDVFGGDQGGDEPQPDVSPPEALEPSEEELFPAASALPPAPPHEIVPEAFDEPPPELGEPAVALVEEEPEPSLPESPWSSQKLAEGGPAAVAEAAPATAFEGVPQPEDLRDGTAAPQAEPPDELPVPTLTLARLARDQGDLDLAVRTVTSILAREPENEAARQLQLEIEAAQAGAESKPAPTGLTEAKVAALQRWLRTVKLAAERRAT